NENPDSIHTIIIDFRTVRDLDASAAFSLERTLSDCAPRNIEVCLSGLRPDLEKRLRRFTSTSTDPSRLQPRFFDRLDSALQEIEAEVLERYYQSDNAEASPMTFLEELASAVPDMDLADVFPIITVADGHAIVQQHAPSDDIYILLEGKAVAEIEVPGGEPLLVARFEAGALIGEMAFYMGSKRTATVLAHGEARLMRIDPTRLSIDGDLPEKLASAFHLIAAKHLSQRLAVANQLMRSALA
ncbi:MAG: cyclic nucleotide-binding domain-containing protein, partial [Hyphomicrobiaceae bacterium]